MTNSSRPSLTYDAKRNRYLIDSSDLEQITVHGPGRPARPLNRYLNEEQTFRSYTRSDNSFYSEGKFFKPNALPWRGGGSRLIFCRAGSLLARDCKEQPQKKGI